MLSRLLLAAFLGLLVSPEQGDAASIRMRGPSAAIPSNPADINVTSQAAPAAYTVPTGWTAPNGAKVGARNYGTTTNGKVLTNTAGDVKLILKSVGQSLDQKVEAYGYNLRLFVGLGNGNFFYLAHAAPSSFVEFGYATGVDETGNMNSAASGNGAWTSLAPSGFANGTYSALVAAGYSPNDTTKRFGLERSGLDLVIWYNGVEVYRVINAHWLAPSPGAVGLSSGLPNEGITGPTITASFSSPPVGLLSNRSTKTLNLADLGFKPIVTTGSISAGSATLTLASNPGITVGDNVAIEPGWVQVTPTAKAGGANTGNGFLRVSTSHHVLPGYRTGSPAYRVRVTDKATRTFTVTRAADSSVVGTGMYGSVFNPAEGPGPEFANEIGFTLNEGQLPDWNYTTQSYVPANVVPFENGDGFDVSVVATGETDIPPWDTAPAAGRLGTIGVGGTYPALTKATPAGFVGLSRAGLVGGSGKESTYGFAVSNGLRFKLTTQGNSTGGTVPIDIPNPDYAGSFSTIAGSRVITAVAPTFTSGITVTSRSLTSSTDFLQAGTTVGALLGTTCVAGGVTINPCNRYAISQPHAWSPAVGSLAYGVKQQTVGLFSGTVWNPIGLDPAAPNEIQVYASGINAGALFEASCITPGTMILSVSWPTATLDQDHTCGTQAQVPGVTWWWNQSFNYYAEKVLPLPLLAKVTAVGGAGNTVLTLDKPAVASTAQANVYVDSSPPWTQYVAPLNVAGLNIVVPAGTYGQSKGWITQTQGRTDWTITGAGRTQTVLKNVRGGTSQIFVINAPVRLILQDIGGIGLHTSHGIGAVYNADGNTDQGHGAGVSINGGFDNIVRRLDITDTIQVALGLSGNQNFLAEDIKYTSNYSAQNYLAQWQIQAPNNKGGELRDMVGVATTAMPMWQTFNGTPGFQVTWRRINSTNGHMAHNSTGGQVILDSKFRFNPYAIDLTVRGPAALNNPSIQSNQNADTGYGGIGISTGNGMDVSNTDSIQVGYVTRYGDVFQAFTGQSGADVSPTASNVFNITGTYGTTTKDGAAKGFVSGPVRSVTATGQSGGPAITNYGSSAGSHWVRMTGPGVIVSGIRVKPYTIPGVNHSTFPAQEGFKSIHVSPAVNSSVTNTISGFGSPDVFVASPGTASSNVSNTAYDNLP